MDQDWFEKILAAERDGELTDGELRELQRVCEEREDLRLQRVMDKKLGGLLNFGGPRRAPRGFAARVMEKVDAEIAAEKSKAAVHAAARAEAERAAAQAEADRVARAAAEAARKAALQPVTPVPKPATPPSAGARTPVTPAPVSRPTPIPPPVASSPPRPVVQETREPWWRPLFGSPLIRVGLGLATLAIFGFQIALVLRGGPGERQSAPTPGPEAGFEISDAGEVLPPSKPTAASDPEAASAPEPRREQLEVAMLPAPTPATELAPTPVTTPEPTPEPTPERRATPEPTPERRGTPEPTPSPGPTATPEPTPTPRPAREVMVAEASTPTPTPAPERRPAVPEDVIPDRQLARVLEDEPVRDDGRPDAKTVLEEVLKSAERAPIIRIDLAHVSGPAPTAAERTENGTVPEGTNGVTALRGRGVLQSRDAANAALREIELALSRFGDIRRLPSDPDSPGVMKLQAQMTPSGLRKFVQAIEAHGIASLQGEAGSARSGTYRFERGGLEVFDGGTGDAKIAVELRIELPG